MKFFVAVSCILAVASAGLIAPAHHTTVIGAHGVPLESADVVAARAFHHAAHVEATSLHHNAAAHSAPWSGDAHGWAGHDNTVLVAPVAAHVAEPVHHWSGPQHLPVIGHNGVPVDTHENTARRAFHHSAHAEAVARNGDNAHGHDGVWGYAAHSTPVAYGAHAVPVVHGVHAEAVHQWSGPQHLAVIGHDGVPVDTHENTARRAFHHAAHAEAVARNGDYAHSHDGVWGYAAHATPVVYGAHASPEVHGVHAEAVHQWSGPQHLAVIGHDGVPVDTHENTARRAFHHSAHAEAVARNGDHAVAQDNAWASGYAAHATPVVWGVHGDSYAHGYQW